MSGAGEPMAGADGPAEEWGPDRATRHKVPVLTVELGKRSFVAIDWSATGFLLLGWSGSAAVGERVAGSATLDGVSGGFDAQIVRADPAAGALAVTFAQVDESLHAALRRIGHSES
jgi:hypothetical protein